MDIWCDDGVKPTDIYFLPPVTFIPIVKIENLADPTLEAQQCDRCGALLKVGDWPWCPHQRDVGYGFRGDFR